MKLFQRIVQLACLVGLSCSAQAQQTCNANIPETTPTADFVDNGNGTVTHSRTGLMWKRCAEGQTWSGGTCTGSASSSTWADALKAVVGVSTGGYSDWRLPNMKELISIVEWKCNYPAINRSIFPSTPASYFWSASANAYTSIDAWYVDFSYGYGYGFSRNTSLSVRLVRSGQSFDALAPTSDTTSPSLSAVALSGIGQTSLSLSATSSEEATGYWLAVTSGATAPTAAEVKSGVNYSGVITTASGSGAMSAGTPKSFTVNGLAAGTSYDFYLIAMDSSNNLSIPPVKVQGTTVPIFLCTLSASPSTITSGGPSLLTANCTPSATSYTWSGGTCTGTITATCAVTPSATTAYTVTSSYAGVTSTPVSATVTVTALIAQAITPITFTPSTLAIGGTTTVSATATSGLPVSFESNTPYTCTIAGSTVTAIASGGNCVITASQGGNSTYSAAMSTISGITVTVTTPPRLLNLSTRGQVQTGSNVMIAGFIIQGSTSKKVLIRARGPSLAAAPFNVPGTLADPFLTLYSGATPIDSNDDYASHPNAASIPVDWVPTNSKESAIVATLNPGAYTAIVTGYGTTSGVALVEVFEIDHPETPLINISTRGPVYTGDNVMIAGLIIQGDTAKTVLIAARGPSIAGPPFNVPGTIANPTLSLYSGQTVIASNDNWPESANAAQIRMAIGVPTNGLESAILITLQPGAYTAIVSGANGGTGLSLVEVFAQ